MHITRLLLLIILSSSYFSGCKSRRQYSNVTTSQKEEPQVKGTSKVFFTNETSLTDVLKQCIKFQRDKQSNRLGYVYFYDQSECNSSENEAEPLFQLEVIKRDNKDMTLRHDYLYFHENEKSSIGKIVGYFITPNDTEEAYILHLCNHGSDYADSIANCNLTIKNEKISGLTMQKDN